VRSRAALPPAQALALRGGGSARGGLRPICGRGETREELEVACEVEKQKVPRSWRFWREQTFNVCSRRRRNIAGNIALGTCLRRWDAARSGSGHTCASARAYGCGALPRLRCGRPASVAGAQVLKAHFHPAQLGAGP